MQPIFIVGLDGLHRAGKATQINLLKTFLSKKEIPSLTIRGDGTRKGIGTEAYDFESEWWQAHYSSFFDYTISLEEQLYLINLASQRMSRENRCLKERYFSRRIQQANKNKGVILMDRTFISHFFVMRQFYPSISVSDSLKSINPKNSRVIYQIIPDVAFVLDVSKEELLRRCESSLDQQDKKEFRKNNILNKYSFFKNALELVRDSNLCNIHLIDGNLPPLEVHNLIKLSLEGILSDF